MTCPRTCLFFQPCWLVYQRCCFVSLILNGLTSITSSIKDWRGCGIHYSSNDQTTDRRRSFLPPLKSSKVSGNLQSNHKYNFGLRVHGLAGVLRTGTAAVNHCQHRHDLITHTTLKSVHIEAKTIIIFPKKEKTPHHHQHSLTFCFP